MRYLCEYLIILASVLILVGCSTASKAPSGKSTSSISTAGKSQSGALPPAGSGRGGYYLDDGPLEQIPDGLYDTPDAEPKIEAYARGPNKPYVIFGKRYVPVTDNRPYKVQGYGSWYGKKFHGKKTSSGEPYDMFKMTAAHPTLPIPGYARVTNLKTDAQIIVRINDRGPFHSDRIIDLSYTAALKLGYLNKGSGQVEVEHILPDEIRKMAFAKSQAPDPVNQGTKQSTVAVKEEQVTKNKPQAIASANIQNKNAGDAYYLQLGAYQNSDNAQSIQAEYALNWAHMLPSVQIVQNGIYYRLCAGPFSTMAQAANVAEKMQQGAGIAKPIIVKR